MTSAVPDRLLAGYRRFRRERFPGEAARFRQLAEGQSPATVIIGCADSRVDPATIFAAAPGELFVVRNVANLVPPPDAATGYHGTSAALEFAVCNLRVADIVVLGHGLCGGVAASLASAENLATGTYIAPWVALLDEARDAVLADPGLSNAAARQRALEFLGIRRSLANLRRFPFVEAALADGQLTLHGAWFSIAEGKLYWLDDGAGGFVSVD
jgi:carbonic anhydrase